MTALPCGDPVDGSLFDMRAEPEAPTYRALIVHGPQDLSAITPGSRLPATVWCADCLEWVVCTDGEFEALREVRS